MAQPRTRRRGEELEQAILDAAWAELEESGYSALTIEAVAARAATSKTVIYRRWPGRAPLVLAAWGSRQPPTARKVDTGALRSDLFTLFTMIARRADRMMSEMIAGVMAEAFRDPEVVTLLQEQLKAAPLAEAIARIVQRAVDRGELVPTRLPQRAALLPLDLIRSQAILYGGPISDDAITELVDDVYLPLLRGLGTMDP